MSEENRYLYLRGNRWHYVRRVPTDFEALDGRGTIRVSLKTASLETARARRDELERADSLYWQSLVAGAPSEQAIARYEAAVRRARAMGLRYVHADDLAAGPATETLRRIEMLSIDARQVEVEAVLGGVARPPVTVSKAFAVYLSEIVGAEVANKSPAQRAMWEKVKRRAVNNFVAVVGDIPISQITRTQAQDFYRWWLDRTRGHEGLSGSAANRDIGNMRKLFREYHAYQGVDLSNPFDGLSFGEVKNSRPPFPTEWIRDRILIPSALASLNEDARLIVYSLIETGARPSEVCNLPPEHIHLNAPVPHISIRPRAGREIKTGTSVRDIPLVGISLAAMRRRPQGFPRYQDKDTVLSNTLNRFFKANNLLPSADHSVYSFRHSFEKRMTEAGLDYGLRCVLMGHSTDRPKYGDGGSLVYRRDQLLRIALPYPPGLLAT